MKEIIVHVVSFKRRKDSNWEIGIGMGEGTGIIVDLEGKQPESIWGYIE